MAAQGKGKRDVLIHFDESMNEIILYTVATEDALAIRSSEFDGLRVEISHLLQMPAADAEAALGEAVLSLVDRFSSCKTGIRPYESLAKDRHVHDISVWESDAGRGNAEAQYILFNEYYSRALSDGDAEVLTKAENMLEASAAQGYAAAMASKKGWLLMKAAAERRLKGGAGS